MLNVLRRYARIIHAIEPAEAERAYREAIEFLDLLLSALDDMLDEPTSARLRERMHLIAVAAQVLAYEFYHQHGRTIDSDAINPEAFKYDFLPPGHRTRRLETAELRREIHQYLQDRFPYTLPYEMR